MQYRYRAYGPRGRLESGTVEAPGREAALARLRSRGLLVERLVPVAGLKIRWNVDLGGPKLNLRQQALFFGQLAMLLEGGLPLLQALQLLAGISRGPLATVLRQMAAQVEGGEPLSRAMAARGQLFPRVAVQIVTVSELAGQLDSGLKLLAAQFDAEDQLQRKFKSAMVYPVIVLVMALGLAAFMTMFIIPNFAEMFADLGAELPWQTRALLAVAGFLTGNWHLLLGSAGAGALLFGYAVRRSEGLRVLVAQLKLRLPVFGQLYWNRESARYCRTLGSMFKSGVPVLEATRAAAELVENAALAARLAWVPSAITEGASLGQAIRQSGALPVILTELLVVGEVIGRTDQALEHIANLADADVKQTLDRLTAILEPVLILILGAIVLSVVVPLLLPMFDLYRNIR